MRKKILGFVFAAAVLAALAVPLFGGAGTAQASTSRVDTPNGKCHEIGHVGGHFGGHSMPSQVRDGLVGFNGGAVLVHNTCP